MKKPLETNKKFLIESNWWLTKIFASKDPLHTLIFVIPLVIGWCIGLHHFGKIEDAIPGLFLGIFVWSFLEYAIHRWLFHVFSDIKLFHYSFGSFHLYHHQSPRDPRVYTSGVIPALFWTGVVISTLHAIGLGPSLILWTGMSMSLSYFGYEWVHYLVHVIEFKGPIMSYLQKMHIDHHINPKINFGQTSPFWDMVFQTYKTPNEQALENRLKHFFIDKEHYKWKA